MNIKYASIIKSEEAKKFKPTTIMPDANNRLV